MLFNDARTKEFDSSNLHSGLFRARTNRLYIRFQSGGIYIYEEVPLEVWKGLKNAPSAGTYFHENIKGTYPYERLDA